MKRPSSTARAACVLVVLLLALPAAAAKAPRRRPRAARPPPAPAAQAAPAPEPLTLPEAAPPAPELLPLAAAVGPLPMPPPPSGLALRPSPQRPGAGPWRLALLLGPGVPLGDTATGPALRLDGRRTLAALAPGLDVELLVPLRLAFSPGTESTPAIVTDPFLGAQEGLDTRVTRSAWALALTPAARLAYALPTRQPLLAYADAGLGLAAARVSSTTEGAFVGVVHTREAELRLAMRFGLGLGYVVSPRLELLFEPLVLDVPLGGRSAYGLFLGASFSP